jgi:shikimate kinase
MSELVRNVFLIGVMGAGKTTIARRLARDLHVASIDVDAYLKRKHGANPTELFKSMGEGPFRDAEAQALKECADMGPAIISCGEGIVVMPQSRILLRDEGFTVLIDAPSKYALSRIHNLSTRPLIAHGHDPKAVMDGRRPLYEKVAHATVSTRGKSTPAIAAEVAKILKSEGVYRA